MKGKKEDVLGGENGLEPGLFYGAEDRKKRKLK